MKSIKSFAVKEELCKKIRKMDKKYLRLKGMIWYEFKKHYEYVKILDQKETETPQRNGFTLVEWGRSILN